MRKENTILCKEETKGFETLPEKEVEGCAMCDTTSKRCLTDCPWPFPLQSLSYND